MLKQTWQDWGLGRHLALATSWGNTLLDNGKTSTGSIKLM